MKIFLHKKDFFVKNKTKKSIGVVILEGFRKKNSEIRINGRVAVCGNSAVLGRVRFFDESYTEGSILCVRGREALDCEALLLCPPIAIVVICDEDTSFLGEICSIGVPCLTVEESALVCELFKNKVALVDTERGVLMLDPSIDTLEYYSRKKKGASLSLSCSVGRILSDVNVEKKSFEGVEYFITDISSLGERDAFESAVGAWEKFCPELLVLELSVPKDVESGERAFCEYVENIYRAALYGSFAISLSGFDTENELSVALRLLHKTFCILEAEGREFNAYLPRGITVSAPIWLMRASPVTNPDFLILDIDVLLPALFSLSVESICLKEKALKKELLAVFESYFLSFAPRCDVYIKTKHFLNTDFLRDLARLADIKVVFW